MEKDSGQTTYPAITDAQRDEMNKMMEHNTIVYRTKEKFGRLACYTDLPNLAVGFAAGFMHSAGYLSDPWTAGSMGITAGTTSIVQGIEKAIEAHIIGEESRFKRFVEASHVSAPLSVIEVAFSYALGSLTHKTLSLFW